MSRLVSTFDLETMTAIETWNSREHTVSKAVLLVNPAHVDLQSEPIPTQWILSGAPEARGTKLTTSNDGTSSVVVWECTPGSFKWDYSARMKPR
jgi:uncharacterized cupin superfamily protein